MSMRIVLAAAAVAVSLSAGQAFAEGEGGRDPFLFQAAPQIVAGRAFVTDAGTEAYPRLTGSATQPSSLAQLEPAAGSEAPIQTANSLPRGFEEGTVAYAQAQSLNRYMASVQNARYRTAGAVRPRS